jgi:hypothetical protein
MDRFRHAFLTSILMLTIAIVGVVEGSQESARAKLEKARENVRLSEATYRQISAELEELKSSEKASPDLVKNYEIYLQRVGEIRDENRRILEKMEKAYTMAESPRPSEPGAVSGKPDLKQEVKIPEEEGGDRVKALDRQFKDSLASFDEMILKEMDRIRTASALKMRGLAQEAAAAAKRIKDAEEALSDQDSSGEEGTKPEGAEKGQEAPQKPGESGEKNSGVQKPGTDTGARPQSSKPGSDESTRLSGRGPDSSDQDDDIVARQLREAAEKETDPELKEKLWKEYEEYKKSKRR